MYELLVFRSLFKHAGKTTVRRLIRAASSCSRASCNLKSLWLLWRCLPSGNLTVGYGTPPFSMYERAILQSYVKSFLPMGRPPAPANSACAVEILQCTALAEVMIFHADQRNKSEMRTHGCRSTLHQCPDAEMRMCGKLKPWIWLQKTSSGNKIGKDWKRLSREPNECGKANDKHPPILQ